MENKIYLEHRRTGMPIMNNTITNTTYTWASLTQHTQFCDDTFFGLTKLTSKIQYVHNKTLGLLTLQYGTVVHNTLCN